jgi:cytochrome P450
MNERAPSDVIVRNGFDHGSDRRLLAGNWEEWNRLREESPAFVSDIAPGYNIWYLLRYEDNVTALQDWGLFSSGTTRHLPDGGRRMLPTDVDPPEHTKYRRVLSPHFAPNAVRAWEGEIRATCAALIEDFRGTGRVDFVRDFAQRLPTTIFLRLMGLPLDRASQFIERAHRLMATPSEQDPEGTARHQALREINADLREVIDARRRVPQDDLISRLLDERIDGSPLSDDDLLALGLLLYLAGLDTVANLLTYAFRHLARDRGLRVTLASSPERVPEAVEEFLRLYSIVSAARVVTRDAEFAGCPMKRGDRIVYSTAAADRDPRQFPDPDTFDLNRTPNRHIAFGVGPHRCVGSHLARLELRVALEEWLQRIPDFEIPEGSEWVQYIGPVAGLSALPLSWPIGAEPTS